MTVGMLWFDNDSNSDLTSKVARAASYYVGKYGDHPNLCYIHPRTASKIDEECSEEQEIKAGEIEVLRTIAGRPHQGGIGSQSQS